jgi:hypothetical protein
MDDMADGVGLSVGSTNLTAVVVGRTAVTRSAVLTLYPHRPPEVGIPSENPNLNERGLIITDFVDRVGDPVGIVASDGSMHRGEVLVADALRAMLYAVGRGRPPAGPIAVTYPAHWTSAAVDALRNALAAVPEFGGPEPPTVVSDASAALMALQADPGLPTSGVVVLCDFGATGTSITLADAANGYQPVAPTLRDSDLSGDLIDQALLTHVINDLTEAGSVDLSSTSAIGSLSRLRAQCRMAKVRLSTETVTSLPAELPGYSGEVRLTRNELEEAIRQPLAEFIRVLQEALDRSGVRPTDLAAVASSGGGARIPIVTTTLSEHFRVPVITTPQPELTAAIGGGLAAVHGAAEDGVTAMAAAAPATAAAAALAADPVDSTGTVGALAWSDADDLPEVASTGPYEYGGPAAGAAAAGSALDARPDVQFGEREVYGPDGSAVPWYRRPVIMAALGVLALLIALAVVLWFVLRDNTGSSPTPTTAPVPTTTTAGPSSSVAPPPGTEQPAPQPQAPQTVTETVPPPTRSPAPPPPPPSTEAPPPAATEAPPPATTEPPPPPATTQPPVIPTIPTVPYPTIPGLPFVPAPPGA